MYMITRPRRATWRPITAILLASLLLSACSTFQKQRAGLRGTGVDIDAADLANYTAAQGKVVTQLIELSGQGQSSNPDWDRVTEAGVDYVNSRCERYIESLFWFDRQRKTLSTQINLVGTATAGTLGIANAAAEAIALTAVAFGLASQTVDNVGKGVLYEIDPAGVRSIVKRSQAAYLRGIENIRYTNRPAAMRAIQGYLALCLPAALEAEVNEAIGRADFAATTPPTEKTTENFVPSVSQVSSVKLPPVDVVTRMGRLDPIGVSLKAVLFRDGKLDPVAVGRMRAVCWPAANVPPDTKLTDFVTAEEFAAQRTMVADCLAAGN